MSLSEWYTQKLRYSIHTDSPSSDVSYVRVDKSGDYTRYVTNDMAIAQEAYRDKVATVRYDADAGEYTVEFRDVTQMPIAPYMPVELQKVDEALPDGCTLEYQFADGMWHVVQEEARLTPFEQFTQARQESLDTIYEKYSKWNEGQSAMDKETAEKRAHDLIEMYATGDMRSGDGYLVTIDDAGKVLGMPCHDFTLDAPVVLPEGQQMPLQNLRYDWYPNVLEVSESDLRASQGYPGHDTGYHFLEPSLHIGEQEFASTVIKTSGGTDLTFHIYQSGGTIANEMVPQSLGFADALKKLQIEAGESAQGVERLHNDILGLAKDTDVDTSCALMNAIDDMYDDPDDSANRTGFYKVLAAYMMDNDLEVGALEIALMYEQQDRIELEAEKDMEQKEVQKSAVQDYYNKVWE